jgi:hypothetical protein
MEGRKTLFRDRIFCMRKTRLSGNTVPWELRVFWRAGEETSESGGGCHRRFHYQLLTSCKNISPLSSFSAISPSTSRKILTTATVGENKNFFLTSREPSGN